jgi:large exoprotein involved in heme utilization and adhesion
VAGALVLRGGGDISASTAASGAGGNLLVRAGSLLIDGSAAQGRFTGLAAESGLTNGNGRIPSGRAGNLTAEVTGALILRAGGEINVSTAGFGDAGTLTVRAGSLSINGAGLNVPRTGIINASNAGATGNAGAVNVTVADALTIRDGGQIVASTFTSGRGGDLLVSARSLTIDGSATPGEFTGIDAASSPGASGDAGSLTVHVTDGLTLRGRGEISASTFSAGAGGNLLVTAGSLSIDGSATPHVFTGIDAGSTGTGNAGNLTVEVDGALSITASGEISVTTFRSGRGGVLTVDSGSLEIDGTKTEFDPKAGRTGIFAASSALSGGGQGGDITINSGEVSFRAGGVAATSSNSAPSGPVTLDAAELSLAAFGAISSANGGSGRAGSVTIHTTGAVEMSGASAISTSALLGDAGDIQIRSGSRIELLGQSTIASSAGQNGGNITLTAPDLVHVEQSAIVATAGTQLTTTGAGGQGGNITIDPTFIVLDRSLISANAAAGQGGNILLDSLYFLNSASAITATGTTAGTIVITSPELDLTNALVPLSGALLDASSQLREQCAQRLGQDFSSFLVLGRGGVETSPDEPQASGSDDTRKRGKKTPPAR